MRNLVRQPLQEECLWCGNKKINSYYEKDNYSYWDCDECNAFGYTPPLTLFQALYDKCINFII